MTHLTFSTFLTFLTAVVRACERLSPPLYFGKKESEKGIVKLLGMILSPGNRRHFPDAISTDPTLRRPAPYPLFRPNFRSGFSSLRGTPTRTADAWYGGGGAPAVGPCPYCATALRAVPAVISSPPAVLRSPLASGHPDTHRVRTGSR